MSRIKSNVGLAGGLLSQLMEVVSACDEREVVVSWVNEEILDSFINGVDGFQLEGNFVGVNESAVVTFFKWVGFADSVQAEWLV